MGKKVSSWLIIFGCFLMVGGIGFLPAAMGNHPDPAILDGGIFLFSLGTLTVAGGVYVKAVALQGSSVAEPAKPQAKRSRGGCDLCGTEIPVVNCRVHQLHLCGACVGKHYDFRSCVYVPSTRRPAPVKAMARAAGRA
jgi:hypothetical protein